MRILLRIFLAIGLLLVLIAALYLILRANGITVLGSGGHRIVASDDIIWVVPWENGHYREDAGFEYSGTSVDASEHSGVLRVGGRFYGTVTIGDSVDLTTRGVVLVNGKIRHPRQSSFREDPATAP